MGDVRETVLSVMKDVSPRGFANALRARHPDAYDAVREQPGQSVAEQAHRLVYGNPECEACGGEPAFVSLSQGFRRFCSEKCADSAKRRRAELECEVCGGSFEALPSKADRRRTCSPECQARWLSERSGDALERRRETVRSRYGVDNVFELDEVRERGRQTRVRRYGDADFTNREQARETSLERYDEEHPMRDPDVSARMVRSQRERYGGVGLASQEIREKVRETNLKRHGAEVPQRTAAVKRKARETCERRHGGQGMASEALRGRIERTNLETYGHRVASKSERVRERISGSKRGGKLRRLLSHPSFADRFEARFAAEDYEGVEGYIEYPFLCKRCGEEFDDHLKYVTPRCPECDLADQGSSLLEDDLATRLMQRVGGGVRGDRSVLGGREIDVLFPDSGLAVEFDGLYWHGEARGGKGKNYHLSKTLACAEAGIRLVHVFEDEWLNRPAVVLSRLSAMAGEEQRSIGARECEVRRVSAQDARQFLDQYHLQGFQPSALHMALFLDAEIVQVASFGRRPQLSGGAWELTRLAALPDTRVQGGASRLVRHGVREAAAPALVSFADRRWTPAPGSTVYEACGFSLEGVSEPGYWYVTGPGERRHRYGFAKHRLADRLDSFDPELTEWENMRQAGYDRVWDCGQLSYKLSV